MAEYYALSVANFGNLGAVLRIRIRIFFGPPGSGSLFINQRYWSGSDPGSFYHQAKIVKETLIPTVLWLLVDFLSVENNVNVPSKSNKQKNIFLISFLFASWRSMTKIAGSLSESGSISQRHGSADPDPDPHQNVMVPQQCLGEEKRFIC